MNPKFKIVHKFIDKIANEVIAGDFIVYGHSLGRSAGLRIGMVVEIKHDLISGFKDEEWRIKVRGWDDDWAFDPSSILDRESILKFPQRIMKINHELPLLFKQVFWDLYPKHDPKSPEDKEVCPACDGSKRIDISDGHKMVVEPCNYCETRGYII